MAVKDYVCESPACDRPASATFEDLKLCGGHVTRAKRGKPIDTPLRAHSGKGGVNKSITGQPSRLRHSWNCESCDKETQGIRYGGTLCRSCYRSVLGHLKELAKDLPVECDVCGKDFVDRRRKYCSQRCSKIMNRRQWHSGLRERRKTDPELDTRLREAAQARRHRRRAHKDGATFTVAEWRAVKQAWDNRCAYCGDTNVDLQVEHMLALSRGGEHAVGNIVPACMQCNTAKNTKTPSEWLLHMIRTRRLPLSF